MMMIVVVVVVIAWFEGDGCGVMIFLHHVIIICGVLLLHGAGLFFVNHHRAVNFNCAG